VTHDDLAADPRVVEVWRAVHDYEGLYEVSSFGRVLALPRIVIRKNRRTVKEHHYRERVLSERARKSGYVYVGLSRNNHTWTVAVHRLVLEAFIGKCPDGMECRHKDDDGSNNRLANVAWGTPVENAGDRVAAGTYARGDRHRNARFNEAQLQLIAADAQRLKPGEVTAKWGISRTHLARVVRDKARSKRPHGRTPKEL